MDIRRIGTLRCRLGEGPLWDVAEQALYFIDGRANRLWRYQPGPESFASWETPLQIGSMALRKDGGAILALEDGFYGFDFATGQASLIAKAPGEGEKTSLNDGKVDARGRFLAGGCVRSLTDTVAKAGLHRLDPDGSVTTLEREISVSNGPCWSPDGRTLYFADSMPRTVFAYDYDLETGGISNKRVFLKTGPSDGIPDGATVDAQGRYWVALCLAGKIACYRPDGELERTVEVPAGWVSSVMFGGPRLDQLYFTSIDPDVLGRPSTDADGGLYVIDGLGATGLPEPRFGG